MRKNLLIHRYTNKILRVQKLNGAEQKLKGCFICNKHRAAIQIPGGAIYQDNLVYAGHVRIPEGESTAYLGHLTVETKRHIPGLAELVDSEAQALGLLIAHLSKALKDVQGAEHVYLFVLGHHTHHLHIHIVPRYRGTPRKYWDVSIDEWPDAPRGGPEEIETVCAKLRDYLRKNFPS